MPGKKTASDLPPKSLTDTPDSANPEAPQDMEVHDRLIGVIVLVTCILLVSNSISLNEIISQPYGEEVKTAVTQTLVAFLLNLALLFIGWRRYRQLQNDIKNYVSAEKRAQHLAVTDSLTGLYNRRAITDLTTTLITQANASGKAVAFMLLDVDDFKQVNDVHGHSTGDYLLCQMTERIKRHAPKRAYLSRIGGDEFAFSFLFDPAVPQEAMRFAQAIIEEMQDPFEYEGTQIEATVTIGIAQHNANDATVGDLMRRADMAMYSAKRAGKNSMCWFDSKMEDFLHSRVALESAVRAGVAAKEFVPFFEPLIDLKSQSIIGFEMLARWNNENYRDIPTEEFIEIAQDTGVIGALSVLIMEQAFIEARNWDSSLTLSINISPVQLLDEKLAQHILQLLTTTGFPPGRLEVEVTESAIFQNIELARAIIQSLKNQGIRIAYDDFGTGYSSLTHLRELPFDRIKIDRSFISAAAEDQTSATLVKAIVNLCNTLSLPITAEGIENEAIFNVVSDYGVMVGQGHYFSKALSRDETRRLLAKKNLLPARRQLSGNAASLSISTSMAGMPPEADAQAFA